MKKDLKLVLAPNLTAPAFRIKIKYASMAIIALSIIVMGHSNPYSPNSGTYLSMATFTTTQAGNWNSGSTWVGGSSPGSSIGSNDIVNILHDVYYNESSDLEIEGVVHVGSTTDNCSSGTITVTTNDVDLLVQSGRSLFVRSSGTFTLINGTTIWEDFECGGSQSGNFVNEGGCITVIDSRIDVHQNWETNSGGKRHIEGGCLRCGENYNNSGTLDTLINTCIEVGFHGSGNVENTDGSDSKIHIIDDVQFLHANFNDHTDAACNLSGSGNFSNSGTITGAAGASITGLETPGNISNSGTWVTPTVAEWCAGGSDQEVPAGSGAEDCAHFDNLTCGSCAPGSAQPDPPAIVDLYRDLCLGESSLIEVVTATLNIYEETFDNNNEGVEGEPDCVNIDPPTSCPDYTAPTNNQWTITGSTYNLDNNNDYLMVAGNKLEGRDIDGTLCFESILLDISSFPTVDFSLDNSDNGNDMEAGDDVVVSYSLDGGAFTTSATFNGNIAGTQTVVENGLIGNTLKIQVCFTNNANQEEYTLDNVLVTYIPSVAATYNFYTTDPEANPGSIPVASGTSYDPMIASETMDTIWVTCSDGVNESDPIEVILNNDCIADLELTKTIDDTAPTVGETVTYSITVKNNGPHDATGVAVTDTLPSELTYVMGTIAGPGIYNDLDPNGAGLMWSDIDIPLNDSVTLTFDAVINSSAIINNSAEVTASDQDDPNSTPDNNIPTEDDQDDVEINPVCTSTNANIQISQN